MLKKPKVGTDGSRIFRLWAPKMCQVKPLTSVGAKKASGHKF